MISPRPKIKIMIFVEKNKIFRKKNTRALSTAKHIYQKLLELRRQAGRCFPKRYWHFLHIIFYICFVNIILWQPEIRALGQHLFSLIIGDLGDEGLVLLLQICKCHQMKLQLEAHHFLMREKRIDGLPFILSTVEKKCEFSIFRELTNFGRPQDDKGWTHMNGKGLNISQIKWRTDSCLPPVPI